MSYVLGIDPSLTATGLAWISDDPVKSYIDSTTYGSKGSRDESLTRRGERIGLVVTGLIDVLAGIDVELAVLESAAHGVHVGSVWDRAGLWWALVRTLQALRVPVATCNPVTRIKWATGKGKASESTKTDVGVALLRLWPEVQCDGDGEWDALALATMGAQHLGWSVPHRAHHEAARKAIRWPERDRLVTAASGVRT